MITGHISNHIPTPSKKKNGGIVMTKINPNVHIVKTISIGIKRQIIEQSVDRGKISVVSCTNMSPGGALSTNKFTLFREYKLRLENSNFSDSSCDIV